MSKHETCQHCTQEIFYSAVSGKWLHWYTSEPSCGLNAEPAR